MMSLPSSVRLVPDVSPSSTTAGNVGSSGSGSSQSVLSISRTREMSGLLPGDSCTQSNAIWTHLRSFDKNLGSFSSSDRGTSGSRSFCSELLACAEHKKVY
jgi:hypothetical protein